MRGTGQFFSSIGSRIDGVENSMTFTLVSIFCNEAYSTFSLSTYGRSTSSHHLNFDLLGLNRFLFYFSLTPKDRCCCPLLMLPPELLLMILRMLPLRDLHLAVALVSLKFEQFKDDQEPILYKYF